MIREPGIFRFEWLEELGIVCKSVISFFYSSSLLPEQGEEAARVHKNKCLLKLMLIDDKLTQNQYVRTANECTLYSLEDLSIPTIFCAKNLISD